MYNKRRACVVHRGSRILNNPKQHRYRQQRQMEKCFRHQRKRLYFALLTEHIENGAGFDDQKQIKSVRLKFRCFEALKLDFSLCCRVSRKKHYKHLHLLATAIVIKQLSIQFCEDKKYNEMFAKAHKGWHAMQFCNCIIRFICSRLVDNQAVSGSKLICFA